MNKYFEIKNEHPDTSDFYNDLEFFYISNKEELSAFISDSYMGRLTDIDKIPMNQWFLYYVDNSGDNTVDSFILVSDYIKELKENQRYYNNMLLSIYNHTCYLK